MIYTSEVSRNELFVHTATLAAHSSNLESGFRQRDVLFFIELFSNWIECALPGISLSVQNTQVLRYLGNLKTEGYLKQSNRKGRPRYALTRIGLLELVTRVVSVTYVDRKEEFFFLVYFLSSYRPRLEALVTAEGRQFPHSLRIELEILLNVEELIERELKQAHKELKKLQNRMHEASETVRIVEKLDRQKSSLVEILSQLEHLYPYELNSQKPLTELIMALPPAQRKWEITEGNTRRIQSIWNPSERVLKTYIEQLEHLLSAVR